MASLELSVLLMNLNPCGHHCDKCPSYFGTGEPACSGCRASNGTPWWGTCRVFKCSAGKGLPHCGLCEQFPCDRLVSHYDPDNPQGPRNAVIRTGILAYRAKHGDDKAIELVQKLMAI
ncbi:MAG: DUF3795 domain-containing protein [Candidatus Thorarchaeota archaeon]|nr:DUF3795 domain-containing protein [Candidatus Thorarchaeota archaeon]